MDELTETLNELFHYFKMEDGEWPLVSCYARGELHTGAVDDELYDILIRLSELYDNKEGLYD